MLLRCFSHFRAEPFTDVVVVLCPCCLFALLFLPSARAGEYLPLFGFHHLAMIVMNMDSNIKDNGGAGYLAHYRNPARLLVIAASI